MTKEQAIERRRYLNTAKGQSECSTYYDVPCSYCGANPGEFCANYGNGRRPRGGSDSMVAPHTPRIILHHENDAPTTSGLVFSQEKLFTVADLKSLLVGIDDNLPVGVIGHYGEFLPLDKYNFRIAPAAVDFTGQKRNHWESREILQNPEASVLAIEPVDRGPEPD